jgi:hypothetical protein
MWITKIGRGDFRPQARHPGSVDEHVSDRHDVLAVRAELGPHIRHALVIGQLAAFSEHVHHRRGDALARGRGEEQGSRGHRLARPLISGARDRVDDHAPLVHDRDLQPDLIARCNQLVDPRLHLPLQVSGRAHRSKRQVTTCSKPANHAVGSAPGSLKPWISATTLTGDLLIQMLPSA